MIKMITEDIKKEIRKSYLRTIDAMIWIYGDKNVCNIWLDICKTAYNPSSEYGRDLIAEDDEVYGMITEIFTMLTIRMVS